MAIRKDLIKKRFKAAQLMPNILINTMLHGDEKHDKAMSKTTSTISKLVSNQHQLIIDGKTLQEI